MIILNRIILYSLVFATEYLGTVVASEQRVVTSGGKVGIEEDLEWDDDFKLDVGADKLGHKIPTKIANPPKLKDRR